MTLTDQTRRRGLADGVAWGEGGLSGMGISGPAGLTGAVIMSAEPRGIKVFRPVNPVGAHALGGGADRPRSARAPTRDRSPPPRYTRPPAPEAAQKPGEGRTTPSGRARRLSLVGGRVAGMCAGLETLACGPGIMVMEGKT